MVTNAKLAREMKEKNERNERRAAERQAINERKLLPIKMSSKLLKLVNYS